MANDSPGEDPRRADPTAVKARPGALRAMLEATSVAVVGASERPGSFGLRLATEALRSPARPDVHLIHPRHDRVLGVRCLPSLAAVPNPVDLVLLGVPDTALVDQVQLAAARGDAGAVVFGPAYGISEELIAAAGAGRMALCGANCMGFVNVARGIRAIGYLERFPMPVGPIAWVSHSGSAFSALLRTHRRLSFSLAVSSGQELVTTAADYLSYTLELPQTRFVALLLETIRDADGLRTALADLAERDVAVVALTVGSSATGRSMVDAHSGALAGDDGAWEALFDAYGVHRVEDLDEMADTLELLTAGRRARRGASGLATVHDSGAERALVADVADDVGVPFTALREDTRARLAALLGPGLVPDNPLDVWSTGAQTSALLAGCLEVLASDPGVAALALAVDLVEEYDEDYSYPEAAERAAAATDIPLAVLSNAAAAVDQQRAGRLREAGIPVLEGTRSGLRALSHLLKHAPRPPLPEPTPVDERRRERWTRRLRAAPLDAAAALQLLGEYGISTPRTVRAVDGAGAVAAAEHVGYPAVLKTDEPGAEHRSDVGGVHLGLADSVAVLTAYRDLERRLGPRVILQPQVVAGVELALGIVRDPALGPLIVLGAGGVLVEVLGQRVVALPPLDDARAAAMLDRLPVAALLDGVRGRPPSDRKAVVAALVSCSCLATEIGSCLEALDVNPLIAGPHGVSAVDALTLPRQT